MSIQANESYRFEQEIVFDGHVYGSNTAFPYLGECQIVRGSDGYYWNGVTYQISPIWNSTTVDTSGLFHYYEWTVPSTVSNGDIYNLKIRITDDPDTESGGSMQVRPNASTGGGGSNEPVFDAVDFATGIPFR